MAWRQAIIWTHDGILLIGPSRTNFSEILIRIHPFSFKEMHLKMSGKWRLFCLKRCALLKHILPPYPQGSPPYPRSFFSSLPLPLFSLFFFSCDQAALWSPSVCPSVRLSHLFHYVSSSYHHEIFRSYYPWQKWGPCKRSRSKVKVTEVKTQLSLFQTVTPVWIHIWCTELDVAKERCPIVFQGHLSNFKVTRLKNCRFWPQLGVSGL